ncbi:hypothetical protein ABTN33_19260, partial [Acinetobacter baumannii]
MLANANAASENLMRMDQSLDQLVEVPAGDGLSGRNFSDFQEIHLEGVGFTHFEPKAGTAFSVGPIDLTVRRGEMV